MQTNNQRIFAVVATLLLLATILSTAVDPVKATPAGANPTVVGNQITHCLEKKMSSKQFLVTVYRMSQINLPRFWSAKEIKKALEKTNNGYFVRTWDPSTGDIRLYEGGKLKNCIALHYEQAGTKRLAIVDPKTGVVKSVFRDSYPYNANCIDAKYIKLHNWEL